VSSVLIVSVQLIICTIHAWLPVRVCVPIGLMEQQPNHGIN
jgi:hypothetical protein